VIEGMTDGPFRSPEQVDASVQERVREMAAAAMLNIGGAANFKELDPPAVGRLREIRAPALVVLGDRDTSDIHAIGRLLLEQVSGTELLVIPDAGHTLAMEKPDELNIAIDRFLRR
jgi:pimeloyl-ACP methyl ester carboxylesterase